MDDGDKILIIFGVFGFFGFLGFLAYLKHSQVAVQTQQPTYISRREVEELRKQIRRG